MRSSYRRIAMTLIEKFRPYVDVEYTVDVWEGANWAGWGIRVYWTDPKYPDLRLDGIFFHAEDEAEAEAVLAAIETVSKR